MNRGALRSWFRSGKKPSSWSADGQLLAYHPRCGGQRSGEQETLFRCGALLGEAHACKPAGDRDDLCRACLARLLKPPTLLYDAPVHVNTPEVD